MKEDTKEMLVLRRKLGEGGCSEAKLGSLELAGSEVACTAVECRP